MKALGIGDGQTARKQAPVYTISDTRAESLQQTVLEHRGVHTRRNPRGQTDASTETNLQVSCKARSLL